MTGSPWKACGSRTGMTEPLQIGAVRLASPFVLGPMAGYTNLAFRLLCKNAGAGLVFSEMISARGLEYDSRKTRALMAICPRERPVGLQIFGGDPVGMAAAAREAEALGADLVDLNMGCAVPKVRRAGAGTALMEDPHRAVAVAQACVHAVQIPVTVKFRAGLHAADHSYLELGRRLVEVGVAALTLHGRAANAYFRGEACWEKVARLAETVPVPVIGSGDVTDAALAVRRLRETGCAAVMFARGALGKPWVFGQAADLLAGREMRPTPEAGARLAIALCHAQLIATQEDELTAVRHMRSHLPYYTRGLPHAARLRQRCVTVLTLHELRALLLEYLAWLEGSHSGTLSVGPASVSGEPGRTLPGEACGP